MFLLSTAVNHSWNVVGLGSRGLQIVFYIELCDSEQSTIIHTDTKEEPKITSWERGGSSTMKYEEWDSNIQRPYKHRYFASRKYHLEDIC